VIRPLEYRTFPVFSPDTVFQKDVRLHGRKVPEPGEDRGLILCGDQEKRFWRIISVYGLLKKCRQDVFAYVSDPSGSTRQMRSGEDSTTEW